MYMHMIYAKKQMSQQSLAIKNTILNKCLMGFGMPNA